MNIHPSPPTIATPRRRALRSSRFTADLVAGRRAHARSGVTRHPPMVVAPRRQPARPVTIAANLVAGRRARSRSRRLVILRRFQVIDDSPRSSRVDRGVRAVPANSQERIARSAGRSPEERLGPETSSSPRRSVALPADAA